MDKATRIRRMLQKSPAKKLIRVRDADTAYDRLGRYIDSKLDRGYRLRVIKDREANTLELSHYQQLNVDMAISYLKKCNMYLEEIPWRLHKILAKHLNS